MTQDPSPKPTLDSAAIDELRELVDEDTPDFLTDLLQSFLEDARQYLSSLATSLKGGDPVGVMAAAHTLKSSSANLGATQLSIYCGEIEAIARAHSLIGVAALLEAAQNEFVKVQKEIESLPDFD